MAARPRGFDVEQWRAWHRARGESYRWFKAVPVADPRQTAGAERDGRLYVEQAVDAAWKALVRQTRADMEDRDFGLVPKGTASISVMPDETWLARLDRIVLPERRLLARSLVTRGEGTSDELPFAPVATIATVRSGATCYRPDIDYALDGGSVSWLGEAEPPFGTPFSVEYYYHPTYIFIGQEQTPRPGHSGFMPQRGAMLLMTPSE